MTDHLINILQLPEQCLLNKKITKAFFKRNFELTSAERALIDDFAILVGMDWIATISALNSNIPPFNDVDTTFEELQVIALQTTIENFERYKSRLVDLVQKYIPYHLLLIVYCEDAMIWNATLKRINVNYPDKRIIEKKFTTDDIPLLATDNKHDAFFKGVSYAGLEKTNLKTLYHSYIQQIVALQTMGIKGEYVPRAHERTRQEVEYLEQISRIEKEILQLQTQARKESQMNIRVDLNLQIQAKRKQIQHLKTLIIQ